MRNYYFSRFPRIRKSYLDVCSLTEKKHHVPILLECDVSESLKKIRLKKDSGEKISLNSWLVKLVGDILAKHHEIAAYVYNDRSFIVFNEIKLLMIMEKTPNGKPMPLGLLIDKPNEMSIPEIKDCLEEAKNQKVGTKHMLVNKSPGVLETFFCCLLPVLRKFIWKIMLWYPPFAYAKMGNVLYTSVGMVGQIKGWFVHRTIHPVSFGIGSILKKPVVVDDEVKIREILNVTILLDHDVLDGAPMTRFVQEFVEWVESGHGL